MVTYQGGHVGVGGVRAQRTYRYDYASGKPCGELCVRACVCVRALVPKGGVLVLMEWVCSGMGERCVFFALTRRHKSRMIAST